MSSRLTIFRLQLAKPPNPTTPNPLPLVLHKSSPCTNPFPNPHHPLVHRIRFPALSQSSPQHVLFGFASTRIHTGTSPVPLTGRRRPRPLRNRWAPATVTGASPVAPPPARAVRTQTCTAWAWAAVAPRRWSRHSIQAAGLVLLMALDMLEHAG
jgi:hypothetical protein